LLREDRPELYCEICQEKKICGLIHYFS